MKPAIAWAYSPSRASCWQRVSIVQSSAPFSCSKISVRALKDKHQGNLIVSGTGELAHALTNEGLVDEFWFWVHPYLWAEGPRIFDGVGPVPLQLVTSTAYPSGVLWLRYRPATDQQEPPTGA